jgi:steroid delta-isomerase-like uncharacterized protein
MNSKQLAHRWFEEIWNKKNPAVIDELMDPEAVGITEGGEIKGPASFRTMVYEPLVAAFPDVKITVDGMIAENDEVVIRWTVLATHKGALMHLAASNKRVKFSGMTWQRFRGEKIIAGSDSYNLHGLLAFLSSGTESVSVRRA